MNIILSMGTLNKQNVESAPQLEGGNWGPLHTLRQKDEGTLLCYSNQD